MEIKCKKCKYKWVTRSKLIFVSCPSCGTKNKTGGKQNVTNDKKAMEQIRSEEVS
ncbi:MAG: hypothetical protein ACTSQA_00960 [Candidatus Heimdallarchaeaceae archaeon]